MLVFELLQVLLKGAYYYMYYYTRWESLELQ